MKILITGGNGFVGRELCRRAKEFGASEIISLGHSEYNPYAFVNVEICEITDKQKIDKIFNKYKPDIVIHAAAYKHINLMEQKPQDAIQNNILGTINIFDACVKYDVNICVFISTDKASNPSSVYGLTKQVGEQLVRTYSNFNKTKFIGARFCNVYGSSGSVVQIFKECIENREPLKVTDFKMTRYFIKVEEASKFVFDLIQYANNGDICMLYVERTTNIKELAEFLCKEAGVELPIIETGIRPGEKIHEEYNIYNTTQLKDNIYIIKE